MNIITKLKNYSINLALTDQLLKRVAWAKLAAI